MSANIGMMEGAYFVGRMELLSWINSTVGGNYTKIEQTANGVCQCQLWSLLYPGKVALHKLNIKPRHDYEWEKNLKLLQDALGRSGVEKQIDIPRLARGKYQDNLEFMQWLKAFYDKQGGPTAERVGEMRASGNLHANATCLSATATTAAAATDATAASKQKAKAAKPAAGAATETAATETAATATAATSAPTTAATAAAAAAAKTARPSRENAPPNKHNSSNNSSNNGINSNKKQDSGGSAKPVRIANAEISELQHKAEQMQSERDFYFSKLRAIEILCQNLLGDDGDGVGANAAVVDKYKTAQLFASDTLKILYATDAIVDE